MISLRALHRDLEFPVGKPSSLCARSFHSRLSTCFSPCLSPSCALNISTSHFTSSLSSLSSSSTSPPLCSSSSAQLLFPSRLPVPSLTPVSGPCRDRFESLQERTRLHLTVVTCTFPLRCPGHETLQERSRNGLPQKPSFQRRPPRTDLTSSFLAALLYTRTHRSTLIAD